MPIVKSSEAKEGGFGQVREALVAFEADVVAQDARGSKTEFGKWGSVEGKPPREFLQIVTKNAKPTEVTEELSMDIAEGFSFRVNCSDYKGSFWVDMFLPSAEKLGILVPEGLIGKRLGFRRFTLEAKNKDGSPNPQFNSTSYIIEKIA